MATRSRVQILRRCARLSVRGALLATVLALTACGGGGGGGGTSSGGAGSSTFTLGGTVAGLGSNSGLVLANGSTTLTVPAGATSFTFPNALAAGSTYTVTVESAPNGMTCTVAGGSGTLNANVSNVVVTCSTNAYTVGGSIALAAGSTGATVTGLVLANGSDTLNVPTGASSFTMPTPVAYGSSYQVTVKTQPSGMSCSVSPSAPSTMPASAVTNIVVTCSDQPYQLGGTVTINQPPGVTLSDQGMVIDNTSNGDSYTFASNSTSFTMPKSVPYGAAYSLTVATQPSGLTCAINNPSGTMPAGNVSVTVTCSYLSYSISGSVTIIAPSGVSLSDAGMVLTNSGNGDTYTFTSNATAFTMPKSMPYGATYNISVTTQPTNLNCTVSNGAGTMPASNVTNVAVTCSDQTFTLGGTITGLGSASGLVLTNEGTDATTILANATTFTMSTAVPYGAPYSVAVQSSPPNLSCSVSSGGSGTMPAANVTNVAVSCTPGTESVAYSFGASADAAKPYGTLIEATDGNLYGLSESGGANNEGAIFEFDPATNVETVRYSFGSTAGDGLQPKGSLIQASDGNFYGTTTAGGTAGLGTVFEFNPTTDTETVLHSFAGGSSDGSTPNGPLLEASNGNLYGMTSVGGTYANGIIFAIKLSTDSYSNLYSFGSQPNDGANPYGGLIQASNGTLYGMTAGGGASSLGTVFTFDPTTNAETPVFPFDGTDGANPYGSLIQASDGNFYGLTSGGGAHSLGTIFEINATTNAETLLYSFGAAGDGSSPYGSLIQANDGNFYGMTELGGTHSQGTVFEFSMPSSESVLYSFADTTTDGGEPYGSLLQASNGTLYGVTTIGGQYGNGTLFTIN
jgi:uncharacterized repeat protein (TIGR03803 family)